MAWDIQNTYMIHSTYDPQRKMKKYQDAAINLSDFIPESKSLPQILRLQEACIRKIG